MITGIFSGLVVAVALWFFSTLRKPALELFTLAPSEPWLEIIDSDPCYLQELGKLGMEKFSSVQMDLEAEVEVSTSRGTAN